MNLDIELDKAVDKIVSAKAKSVLIQLPDGLKPKAKEIADYLGSKTQAKIYIYLGSCFGACDTPQNVKADLLIQWGHSEWKSD